MDVKFFRSQQEFREWLEKNHSSENELWVGYYKKNSGIPSITWPQSVDEALCFGWIDGIRKSIDEDRYCIRFTPRRKNSTWSNVNTKRITELIASGLVHPEGIMAFRLKDKKKSGIYSFESSNSEFDKKYERIFKINKDAWDFFQLMPPGYKKITKHWVMSAIQENTRLKRLTQLINDSENKQKIAPLKSKNNH